MGRRITIQNLSLSVKIPGRGRCGEGVGRKIVWNCLTFLEIWLRLILEGRTFFAKIYVTLSFIFIYRWFLYLLRCHLHPRICKHIHTSHTQWHTYTMWYTLTPHTQILRSTRKTLRCSLLNTLSTMKPNEQSLEIFFNGILVDLRTCQFPHYIYIQSVYLNLVRNILNLLMSYKEPI